MNRHEDSDKNRANVNTTPESKYPLNQVYQTAGGVRVIVGNEPGKECIKIFHPSGSYVEYMPNGKVVSFNVGENKQYNKGGVTITVDESNDVHIKGHSKIQVGGGAHVEVAGDAGLIIGGSVAMSIPGGDFSVQAKHMYLGATGNFNLNVEGKMTLSSNGASIFESKAPMHVGSAGTITVQGPIVSLNPGGSGSGYDAGEA